MRSPTDEISQQLREQCEQLDKVLVFLHIEPLGASELNAILGLGLAPRSTISPRYEFGSLA